MWHLYCFALLGLCCFALDQAKTGSMEESHVFLKTNEYDDITLELSAGQLLSHFADHNSTILQRISSGYFEIDFMFCLGSVYTELNTSDFQLVTTAELTLNNNNPIKQPIKFDGNGCSQNSVVYSLKELESLTDVQNKIIFKIKIVDIYEVLKMHFFSAFNAINTSFNVNSADTIDNSNFELPVIHTLSKRHFGVKYVPHPAKLPLIQSVFSYPLLTKDILEHPISTDKLSNAEPHLLFTDGRDIWWGQYAKQCALLGTEDAILLSKLKVATADSANENTHGYLDTDNNISMRVHSNSDNDKDSDNDRIRPTGTASIRILCGIYTMEKYHTTKIRAVKETWGHKCTSFVAFSTVNDDTIPAIYVPHTGYESYRNMWQKIRVIWKYIHQHYINEFDYFLLGGDDMYYIMENLYSYLSSPEITRERAKKKGVFLGRQFKLPSTRVLYHSGGSGYILDQIALEALAFNLDEPHCSPTETTPWEDVKVATCLYLSVNQVLPYNSTVDEQNRQRFHPFPPGFQYTFRKATSSQAVTWYESYDPDIRIGFDCCSEYSVSFHYITEKLMYDIDNFIYKCPTPVINYFYEKLFGYK